MEREAGTGHKAVGGVAGQWTPESYPLGLKEVRAAVETVADTVGQNRAGEITIRRSFFYRNGMDADKFLANVERALTAAKLTYSVIKHGEHWATFRGSASIAQGSHWYVVIVKAVA